MIVGFIGKMGAGKSTAANYLIEYGFVEISFAQILKKIAILFGFTEDDVYVNKMHNNEFLGMSFREFAQKFGDIVRDHFPKIFPSLRDDKYNLWIKLAQKEIERLIKEKKNVVVSDVRFLDEADMLKNIGATLIEINRNLPKNEFCNHKSETELAQIIPHHGITNNGTKEEFREKVLNTVLYSEEQPKSYSLYEFKSGNEVFRANDIKSKYSLKITHSGGLWNITAKLIWDDPFEETALVFYILPNEHHICNNDIKVTRNIGTKLYKYYKIFRLTSNPNKTDVQRSKYRTTSYLKPIMVKIFPKKQGAYFINFTIYSHKEVDEKYIAKNLFL